jgi:4-amino-4-deoxychorismate lyase
MTGALRTWVDGIAANTLPADDRGLHYGDGLFETLLIRAGQPRFLELHLARLLRGCRQLGIASQFLPELRAEISAAAAVAPPLALLKILVSRGSAVRRGYAPDGAEQPRRLMWLWAASAVPAEWQQGVELVMSGHGLADDAALAGIKHLNRLPSVIASAQARAAGAFDALLPGSDGRLVSGAMSNLFLVTGGALRTPDVNLAGVAGVMRAVVMREAQKLGLRASECRITHQDLLAADEAFITNARIGVVPVRRLGEHHFTMFATSQRLAAHVEALDA